MHHKIAKDYINLIICNKCKLVQLIEISIQIFYMVKIMVIELVLIQP